MFGRTAPVPQHPGQAVMSPSRMLMGAADRGVHAHHTPVDPPLVIGVGLDRPQHTLPGAVRGPPAMAVVDRLPFPEAGRKISPRQTGALPEQNPVDHAPVTLPTSAPPKVLGQTRFESCQLVIRKITPSHTGQNDQPVGELLTHRTALACSVTSAVAECSSWQHPPTRALSLLQVPEAECSRALVSSVGNFGEQRIIKVRGRRGTRGGRAGRGARGPTAGICGHLMVGPYQDGDRLMSVLGEDSCEVVARLCPVICTEAQRAW